MRNIYKKPNQNMCPCKSIINSTKLWISYKESKASLKVLLELTPKNISFHIEQGTGMFISTTNLFPKSSVCISFLIMPSKFQFVVSCNEQMSTSYAWYLFIIVNMYFSSRLIFRCYVLSLDWSKHTPCWISSYVIMCNLRFQE
jgi:hypothetical protein